jgi:hypothetical protein
MKSSESANSASPGLHKSAKAVSGGNSTVNNLMRRRNRLSTISSEMNEEINESPQ